MTYRVVGHCRADGCGVAMVSKHVWQHKGIRPEGMMFHGGQGLCDIHHRRWRRHGSTEKLHGQNGGGVKGSTHRPRAELLEDYLLIRPDVGTVAQAAVRMGMTTEGLAKALRRAYRDGHTEAVPPQQQMEAAQDRNLTQLYYRPGGTP